MSNKTYYLGYWYYWVDLWLNLTDGQKHPAPWFLIFKAPGWFIHVYVKYTKKIYTFS